MSSQGSSSDINKNDASCEEDRELRSPSGERLRGDGEEFENDGSLKKVDDDEDRRNPQYIPKRGNFYEHDDRTLDDCQFDEKQLNKENNEEILNEANNNKVNRQVISGGGEQKSKGGQDDNKVQIDDMKWGHDKYDEYEQAPKTRQEIIDMYGYDIRCEEAPPRARRRRRYGRGPNKYTRNWEDEDAYVRTTKTKVIMKPKKRQEYNEEVYNDKNQFPSVEETTQPKPKFNKNYNLDNKQDYKPRQGAYEQPGLLHHPDDCPEKKQHKVKSGGPPQTERKPKKKPMQESTNEHFANVEFVGKKSTKQRSNKKYDSGSGEVAAVHVDNNSYQQQYNNSAAYYDNNVYLEHQQHQDHHYYHHQQQPGRSKNVQDHQSRQLSSRPGKNRLQQNEYGDGYYETSFNIKHLNLSGQLAPKDNIVHDQDFVKSQKFNPAQKRDKKLLQGSNKLGRSEYDDGGHQPISTQQYFGNRNRFDVDEQSLTQDLNNLAINQQTTTNTQIYQQSYTRQSSLPNEELVASGNTVLEQQRVGPKRYSSLRGQRQSTSLQTQPSEMMIQQQQADSTQPPEYIQQTINYYQTQEYLTQTGGGGNILQSGGANQDQTLLITNDIATLARQAQQIQTNNSTQGLNNGLVQLRQKEMKMPQRQTGAMPNGPQTILSTNPTAQPAAQIYAAPTQHVAAYPTAPPSSQNQYVHQPQYGPTQNSPGAAVYNLTSAPPQAQVFNYGVVNSQAPPTAAPPPATFPTQQPQAVYQTAFQSTFPTPPTVQTAPELYQSQGGITYYSPDTQHIRQSVIQKRPKVAIPILDPHDYQNKDTNRQNLDDRTTNYDQQKNDQTLIGRGRGRLLHEDAQNVVSRLVRGRGEDGQETDPSGGQFVDSRSEE